MSCILFNKDFCKIKNNKVRQLAAAVAAAVAATAAMVAAVAATAALPPLDEVPALRSCTLGGAYSGLFCAPQSFPWNKGLEETGCWNRPGSNGGGIEWRCR